MSSDTPLVSSASPVGQSEASGGLGDAPGKSVHELQATPAAAFHTEHAAFAEFHEGYVRHYIALADTKASLVFGLSSGVLAYLFSQKPFFRAIIKPTWSLVTGDAIATTLLLGAAALGALLVIVPRAYNSGEGLVFFASVAKFKSSDAYADAVSKRNNGELTQLRLKHCFDVATICTRKYNILRGSLWLLGVGLVAALPLLTLR